MKSRAGAFLRAGGLALPAGSTTTPQPPPLPPPPPAPTAQFEFESGTQGWARWGPLVQGLASSATRASAGSRSLEVRVEGTSQGISKIFVPGPSVPGGRTLHELGIEFFTNAAWAGTFYVDSVSW